ncbi:MAG: ATP-binding cassette domain-containing protein [Rhizobiaceae bacterium]|nr:ATP-binding cassette domain-containing protein [Rhizobiaceae bacterium]
MSEEKQTVLECRDVGVRYGDVVALSGVSISFARGRIHAVVGQNGAGKTTFARAISGLVSPDTGEIRIDGRILPTGNVNQARQAGVELVHQSFALPPSFTVAEAMQFGAADGRIYSRRGLESRWQTYLDNLNVNVKAGQRIRDLPVETLQSVEIARALVSDARLLILDEPTAVLSPEGAQKLFERIRHLKDVGVTVIVILHKIREVLAIADTVAVLRGGMLVEGPVECSGINAEKLAELIIGPAARPLEDDQKAALTGSLDTAHAHLAQSVDQAAVEPVLKLTAVSTRPDSDGPPLEDIDLVIRPGEILGLAGVEGNGQRTLVRAISALAETSEGKITIEGLDVTRASLQTRRAAGLRVIPFERNVEGLSLTSALWENWSARELLQRPLLSMVRPTELRQRCGTALDAWEVHYSNVTQHAGSLSGGNAQKVILSREMDEQARLIIAAQPTRGLDIGATAFVWDSLNRARARGCAILLISSDLDEIMDICDRVVVMLSGRVVGTFTPPYDLADIGAAMTGVSK